MKYLILERRLEELLEKKLEPKVCLGNWAQSDVFAKPDFSYPFDDRQLLDKEYKMLWKMWQRTLGNITEQINKSLGINLSLQQGKILYGPWYLYLLHYTYGRYLHLKNLPSKEDLVGVTLKNSRSTLVSDCSLDFVNSSLTSEYSILIYSELLKKLNFNVEEFDLTYPKPWTQQARNDLSFVDRMLLYLSCFLGSLTSSSNTIFMGLAAFSFKKSILIQLKLGQIPWLGRALPDVKRNIQTDEKLRDNLNFSLGEDEFSQIMAELLPYCLPKSFLENHRAHQLKAKSILPSKIEKAICGNNIFFDDMAKFLLVQVKEQKTSKVFGYQHGGAYGSQKLCFHEDLETELMDQFLTWGFINNPKQIPTRSERAKDFCELNLKSKDQGQFLFTALGMPTQNYLLSSAPIGPQYLGYHQFLGDAISLLPPELQTRCCLRLSPATFEWEEGKLWQKTHPELKLDSLKQSFAQSLTTSSVHIATYNATTFLETLAANYPTLIYWNPLHFELTEQAQKDFAKLTEAGIFHTTAASLQQKLMAITSEESNWWANDQLQRTREEFCRKYAHTTDESADKYWANKLKQVFSKSC